MGFRNTLDVFHCPLKQSHTPKPTPLVDQMLLVLAYLYLYKEPVTYMLCIYKIRKTDVR